jgi:hypothetical protein
LASPLRLFLDEWTLLNQQLLGMLDASDFDALKGRCLDLCNNAIVEVSKDVLFFEAKAISDKGTVS